MKIQIKVHARSKREGVVLQPDGSYKVDVKAPPVEGKANEAVCEVIAEYFKKPKINKKYIYPIIIFN
jgi:uncharacterized protein YggU (UPF0235/DUF167 family)